MVTNADLRALGLGELTGYDNCVKCNSPIDQDDPEVSDGSCADCFDDMLKAEAEYEDSLDYGDLDDDDDGKIYGF